MKYTEDHEWLDETDGMITVGITAHAATQLGDVVFVDLPDVGQTVTKGEEIVVIESVKAASDIMAPLDGEITEVNDALADTPGTRERGRRGRLVLPHDDHHARGDGGADGRGRLQGLRRRVIDRPAAPPLPRSDPMTKLTDYDTYDFANRRHIGPSPVGDGRDAARLRGRDARRADRRDGAARDPAGRAAALAADDGARDPGANCAGWRIATASPSA